MVTVTWRNEYGERVDTFKNMDHYYDTYFGPEHSYEVISVVDDQKQKSKTKMAGFRKYNGNGNDFRDRGFRYNQNGGNGGQRTKKSGATFTQIKTGKSSGMIAVNAWFKNKAGLKTITAFGYSTVKGQNCVFQKAVAEVCDSATGNISKFPVLINVTTKRMAIEKLNLLVTASGGGVTASGKKVRGAVVRLKG